MDASEIQISGNQFLITKTPGNAYRVVFGHILVFVVPLDENDVPGRRWLLCELKSGDVVPTLYHNTPDLKGVNCRWAFGLSALEPATLKVVEDSTEIRNGFAKKFGLRDYDVVHPVLLMEVVNSTKDTPIVLWQKQWGSTNYHDAEIVIE